MSDFESPVIQPRDLGIGRLFSIIREAVIVGDTATGRIVLWNPAAERLFGYPADEAVGSALELIIPDRFRERHRAGLARYHATGHGPLVDSDSSVTLTARRRNGEEFPIELTLAPIGESSADGTLVLAVIRDVTDRYRAESSRARLAAIIQSSDDAVIGMDLDGVVTNWNHGAERLYDYSTADIVGRSISILAPPDRIGEVDDFLARVRRGEHVRRVETVRVRRNGQRVDVSISVSPIHDESGRVVGASTIARDISDRRRAELDQIERLRAEAARDELEVRHQWLAFLARASDTLAAELDEEAALKAVAQLVVPRLADWCIVYLTDPAGAVRRLDVAHANPAKLEMVRQLEARYPADPNASTGVAKVLRTGQSEIYREISDDLLRQTARDEEHVRLLRALGLRSGLIVPLIARARTIGAILMIVESRSFTRADLALAEELAGRCALAVDNARLYTQVQLELAERRRWEAERARLLARDEAARVKDEVISIVSHELRTPLASLVGFAELLLTRDYSEPERRRFLQVMLDEGRRLSNLLNDFLDLQRLESGRQQINPKPVPPRSILEAAVAALGEDPSRPISLDCPADLTPVLADADRIQQVLQNLLSNARKYSPRGGAVLVTARRIDSHVRVAIKDNGLGIPPEALPRLFEKFYRVEASDRRTIQGTGLGLAISRRIVEAHGGLIWAESAGLGQGSCFTFTLPVQVPSRYRGYLLIVEDDPHYGAWLTQTLHGAGYQARLAPTAEAAIEAIGQRLPRAVLLDLRFGGQLDGWDLLAIIRGRTETRNLPVIIISASAAPDRIEALAIQDYLTKPVGRDDLLNSIARVTPGRGRLVLVVEDDAPTQRLIAESIESAGLPVRLASTGEEALAALRADPAAYGLMVLDLGRTGTDRFGVLDALHAVPELRALPVVALTAGNLTETEKRLLAERVQEVVRQGSGTPLEEAVARILTGASSLPEDPEVMS